MFDDLIRAGNYGANILVGVRSPDDLRAMTAEEQLAYIRRQGDPRNVPMAERYRIGDLQNAWRPPVRRPTMTLAEYDARRAAFARHAP